MTTKQAETAVTTWFLTFNGKAKSDISWPEGVQLVEAEIACPELSQFMFRAVGARWRWFSRLSWDYQQWLAYLTTQQVRTWLLWVKGTPAGYIELLKHPDQSVEIKFFGLLPQFIGQGLGQRLAEAAVMLAAQWQASKIWLHTCSADHPSALKNYQQAGFVVTDIQHSVETLPSLNDSRLLAQDFVYSALAYHIESAG
ncbi:GNAT family N-acetyltransferase [Rheinheimera pleomorphica]|uniref:GNAT family N-acetyltransferase n=1 Tax=Rheinheimera pleomorphica TaxID=2703963 RepID=UPI00141F1B25|nr:GNAT family N-acetyltransferase [Rheinheimera pleomorphica]